MHKHDDMFAFLLRESWDKLLIGKGNLLEELYTVLRFAKIFTVLYWKALVPEL